MTAPEVNAETAERTPTRWGPRPVPTDGVGRRTEDPVTPTLRELAARAQGRASLAAAPHPPAWLELAYVHGDDDSPMAGAPYRARFADGSVREGRLDARGTARVDGLSPALASTPVTVVFGEPSAEYKPLPARDEPNPDYRPDMLAALTTSDTSAYASADAARDDGAGAYVLASYTPGAAGHGPSAAAEPRRERQYGGLAGAVVHAPEGPVDEMLEYLWGVVAGAYKQDPSTGEIVGQTIVALVPVVGQIADVRDLSAYIYQLSKPDLADELRHAAWVGLVLTGVALLLPEVGAAVAGVGRLVLKGGPEVERLALPLLRRVGRGDALKYLARALSAAEVTRYATRAFERVSGHLRQFFAAVEHTWLPVGDAARRAARAALAGLGRVGGEAGAAIRRVAAEVEAKAKPLLAKIEGRGEEAAGHTNTRVEHHAPAEPTPRGPEPEGPGGGGREPGRVPRTFSPAQREMIGEMQRAGVKFDEAKLVDVRRMPDGKIVFLEQGGPDAGLQHILDDHAADFARKGIPEEKVPDLVMDTLERGRVIGYQGKGTGRPIYEAIIDGQPQPIAITTGSNGYVVGANPRSMP